MILRIFTLIFLLTVIGCTDSEDNDPIQQLLDSMIWLKKANPNNDAFNAYKEKDLRYLGITGYGLSLPGLPSSMINSAIEEKQYKIIAYCEIIEGQEHMDLCKLAARYTESYNIKLLNLIRKGDNIIRE